MGALFGLGALGAQAVPAAAHGIEFGWGHSHRYTAPWCARFDGVEECGYFTLQQCWARVSGLNGACTPNAFAAYDEAVPAIRHRHRRRSYH